MTTIEEQIRRLADIAEIAEPEPHHRPGRRPRGASLAIAAAIGLLVGGAVWGIVARSPGPKAVTAPPSTDTSEPDGNVASPPSTQAWEQERSYRVVEANLSVSPDEATVDVGSEDGLQPRVGVYGDQLMGIVDEVRATSSTVRLLGSDDLAVRATVTYTDSLGGHTSGSTTIEGTVRTVDDTVVFTADRVISNELAGRLAGTHVVVRGGPGSLLQGKVPIGTIERPMSTDDPSTLVLQPDDARSDGEVTIILPASLLSEPAVSLQTIQARNGPSGTERVALVFDRPLPSDDVVHVTDLTSRVDGAVSYTTQGPADELSICGAGHWGFGTADGVATVDLLIPAAWFDPEDGVDQYVVTPDGTGGEEYFDQIAKIIVCPAIDGVVQVSVAHPASVSAANLDVSIVGNMLVLEAAPE